MVVSNHHYGRGDCQNHHNPFEDFHISEMDHIDVMNYIRTFPPIRVMKRVQFRHVVAAAGDEVNWYKSQNRIRPHVLLDIQTLYRNDQDPIVDDHIAVAVPVETMDEFAFDRPLLR